MLNPFCSNEQVKIRPTTEVMTGGLPSRMFMYFQRDENAGGCNLDKKNADGRSDANYTNEPYIKDRRPFCSNEQRGFLAQLVRAPDF